ncbi:MAG: hypothetical protein EBW38_12265 [Rhodobacteraceae bacterium]|nr:hypothetical protein [Paracoccaceae bacterium]
MQYIKILLAFCLFIFSSATAYSGQAGDGVNRLALQISDNDPATMNKVLNVAGNFARMQSEKGNMFEIEIVAFNAGFQNTIDGMTKKEGKAPPLVESAVIVPGGVGRLLKLDDSGYFVIRP